MVLSLMNQMSTLEKYDFLKDAKIESKFMDRLDKQVENDEYVKNKLLSAIYQKSESIEQINNFNITNNYWNEFKPMLNVAINWTPDKIISKDSLQDLNLGNYKKMLSVCLENYIYQSHLLIKQIFNQVKDEKPVVIILKTLYIMAAVLDTKGKQEYLSHFINKNQDMI